MKTKEQWLEEFGKYLDEHDQDEGGSTRFNCNSHSEGLRCCIDDGHEYKPKFIEYFSNALEQYAKEYCLEVIRRSKPDKQKAFEAPRMDYEDACINLGFNQAIDAYESAMKKEISV